ncbi:MAG: hypothetical protein JSW50_08565, partial [Candidatus Latescibacterota bacterium]
MLVAVWIVGILFAAFIVWILTVIPRARQRKETYLSFMRRPLAVWTPPKEPPAKTVTFPDLQDVSWQALSSDVDSEGIKFVDYDAMGQRGVSGQKRYPSDIAEFAVKRARRFAETGNQKDLLLAARQLTYLADTAKPVEFSDATGVAWCAEFDLGYQYGVEAPWKSAYLQSFSMCAMLWGHWLTGDHRYLDLYRKGVITLGRTMDNGGLAYKTSEGGLFFEEVVSSPPHHILNGHLHTLLNLFHSHEITDDELTKQIFELGVQGTVDLIPRFDRYGYSLYSLAPKPGLWNHFNIANPFYHHAHVGLLRT